MNTAVRVSEPHVMWIAPGAQWWAWGYAIQHRDLKSIHAGVTMTIPGQLRPDKARKVPVSITCSGNGRKKKRLSIDITPIGPMAKLLHREPLPTREQAEEVMRAWIAKQGGKLPLPQPTDVSEQEIES